jgi:hypothetical protein
MTPSVPDPGNESTSPRATPVYSESELYDSPEKLEEWRSLKPLLLTWQKVVWDADHSQDHGFWYYDQEAIRLQNRLRRVVRVSAIAGTAAVVLAILQLGLAKQQLGELPEIVLLTMEVACLIAAVIAIFQGLRLSVDHRWREFRFKAEQYRTLKFRFLHDAVKWLGATEEQRTEHLQTHIAKIHSANRESIKAWIHWKQEFLPELVRPQSHPDKDLAKEITRYFSERRLIPQQEYFQRRGHELHIAERRVRWVGPTCFFVSVAFALVHAVFHIPHILPLVRLTSVSEAVHPETAKSAVDHTTKTADSKSGHHADPPWWLLLLALPAAILPVVAAGVRTWRGAFEFGRNSLRFESMAHHLDHLLKELKAAETPEGKLAILRRGEYAMESEHRSWMRLMMEAEWFG